MTFSFDSRTLYRIPELSRLLGLSKYTVRLLLREKNLKGTKLGKHWYVTGDELKNYFNVK